MSTTEFIGIATGYTQPTLGLGFINPMEQPRHAVIGIHLTASNSITNLFQTGPNAGAVELIFPTNPLSYKTAIELHSKVASIFCAI